jgi:hypothetical protein
VHGTVTASAGCKVAVGVLLSTLLLLSLAGVARIACCDALDNCVCVCRFLCFFFLRLDFLVISLAKAAAGVGPSIHFAI